MAVQTSYSHDPAIGLAGQVRDTHQGRDIVSAIVEEADGIKPGRGVVQGTADGQVSLPSASLNTFQGITVLDTSREESLYGDEEAVGVMRAGRILVEVEDAVSKDGQVFVRHSSGAGGSELGAFRSDGDTSTAAQITNAVYRSSAGAGELAVVEIMQVGSAGA